MQTCEAATPNSDLTNRQLLQSEGGLPLRLAHARRSGLGRGDGCVRAGRELRVYFVELGS